MLAAGERSAVDDGAKKHHPHAAVSGPDVDVNNEALEAMEGIESATGLEPMPDVTEVGSRYGDGDGMLQQCYKPALRFIRKKHPDAGLQELELVRWCLKDDETVEHRSETEWLHSAETTLKQNALALECFALVATAFKELVDVLEQNGYLGRDGRLPYEYARPSFADTRLRSLMGNKLQSGAVASTVVRGKCFLSAFFKTMAETNVIVDGTREGPVRKMLAKMDKREKAEKQAPVGSSKYVPLTTMDDKKRI